jgi:hypothetical protein
LDLRLLEHRLGDPFGVRIARAAPGRSRRVDRTSEQRALDATVPVVHVVYHGQIPVKTFKSSSRWFRAISALSLQRFAVV